MEFGSGATNRLSFSDTNECHFDFLIRRYRVTGRLLPWGERASQRFIFLLPKSEGGESWTRVSGAIFESSLMVGRALCRRFVVRRSKNPADILPPHAGRRRQILAHALVSFFSRWVLAKLLFAQA